MPIGRHMFGHWLVPAVVVVALVSLGPPLAGARDQRLLPSLALHRVFDELRSQPTKQGEIAASVLSQTTTTGLDVSERFALAELYFAAIMPKEATSTYLTFADGHDQRARTANQRVLFMKMVAFQSFDGVEAQIAAYRKRFPPDVADLYGLDEPVFALAEHYRSTGADEEVVALVGDEVGRLPDTAPFYSYGLLPRYADVFVKAGRRDDLLRLLRRAEAGYRDVPESAEAAPPVVVHRPGVVHRVEEQLRADYESSAAVDASLVSGKRKISDSLKSIGAGPSSESRSARSR
jgi:hypothetical protein